MKINQLLLVPGKGFIFYPLFFLTVLLFPPGPLNAQEGTEGTLAHPVKTEIIPPSPNVASLGKYGNIPVSYYSGQARLNIPLYTISFMDMAVPISMDYSSSGLLVEETPSWAGMGWALNAGGVITRAVRGLPDEIFNGYLGPNRIGEKLESYFNTTLPVDERKQLERYVLDGFWDGEPDVYYFNFCGRSGKFFIDKDHVAYTIPHSTIKIEFTLESPFFKEWRITDENGIQYIFDQAEITEYDNISGGLYEIFGSGWYLSEIISSNKISQIRFRYSESVQAMPRTVSETKKILKKGTLDPFLIVSGICKETWDQNIGMLTITTKNLEEIDFSIGRVVFNECDRIFREDLTESPLLNDMEVKDKHGHLIRAFEFEYGYHNAAASFAEEKRLFLKSIKESGKPPYRFEYYGTGQIFPSRSLTDYTFYAQDHWGFYNGIPDYNRSLTPAYQFMDGQQLILSKGPVKSPDDQYARQGLLWKVHYPTGGSTEFEYEGNDFKNSGDFITCDVDFSAQVIIHNDETNDLTVNENFEIRVKQCVELHYILHAEDLAYSGEGTVSFELTGPENFYYTQGLSSKPDPNNNLQGSERLVLAPGTYHLTTFAENHSGVVCWADVQISYNDLNPGDPLKVKAGGVRIKKIRDCESENSPCKVSHFSYVWEDEWPAKTGLKDPPSTFTSTGLINNYPEYDFDFVQEVSKVEHISLFTTVTLYYDCLYKALASRSHVPLAGNGSGYVGYSKVTVYEGEQGENGKTEYYYSNVDQHPDIIYAGFPFPSPISLDHRRGILEQKIIYRNDGHGIFTPVMSEKNDFYYAKSHSEPHKRELKSIKIGYLKKSANNETFDLLKTEFSSLVTEWDYPLARTVTRFGYPDPSQALTQKETYYYDNPLHIQLTRNLMSDSEGNQRMKKILYPQDYQFSVNDIFGEMADRNLRTKPVEIQDWLIRGSDTLMISSQLISYGKTGHTIHPVQIYRIESEQPFNNFIQGKTTMDLFPDSRYHLEASFEFDAYGNLSNHHIPGNISTCYLWGYDHTLPVLKGINCVATEVYYEGFEEENISFPVSGSSRAGLGFYAGSVFNIPFNPADGKNYWMEYWYFEDGKWKKKGPVDFSPILQHPGAEKLDEIRVYPEGCRMFTFTAAPLVGITSETGPENLSAFYHYDLFGRLKSVRDFEGYFLKSFQYHYKNQDQ